MGRCPLVGYEQQSTDQIEMCLYETKPFAKLRVFESNQTLVPIAAGNIEYSKVQVFSKLPR